MQPLSYQLLIWLERPLRRRIGALGEQDLPAGLYVYTGSARRNPLARLQRHLRRGKPLRWHVDYLLEAPEATVVDVLVLAEEECGLNQSTGGTAPVAGFGASDCRSGCGSHLRFLGTHPAVLRGLWP